MNLDEPPRFPRQRIRTLAHALLAGAMLVVILTPVGEAQRGPGRGRQRPPEPAPPEPSAAGEYALDGPQAIAAVNRGEGQQALAYYERTAREAEQQRDQVRAARAWHAATMVSIRLGRYQKAIRSGSRTIDLFKSASGLTQPDIVAWASTYHSSLRLGRLQPDGPAPLTAPPPECLRGSYPQLPPRKG
jgi:tetratricopeptide (TPR) repeat protein